MENELNLIGPQRPEPSGIDPSERLELAHVMFMDLVAFSTLPMEEQRQALSDLQKIVQDVPAVRDGERNKRLICLPTGDGMALVFFGDPMACVESALEIAARVASRNLKLRMGINTGPVFRVADINANLNVSGGGINNAQRIMDAGDSRHILVSQSTAEILQQLKAWAPYLHDLGEHAVKHGVKHSYLRLGPSAISLAVTRFRRI